MRLGRGHRGSERVEAPGGIGVESTGGSERGPPLECGDDGRAGDIEEGAVRGEEHGKVVVRGRGEDECEWQK